MSAGVPVLAAATVTLPAGQARWAFPHVPRVPYPTGVQVPCAVCVRSGRPRPSQGMPDRFGDGDPTPLCVPCWRTEQDRRLRVEGDELLARFWDGVGGVQVDAAAGGVMVAVPEPVVCPVCARPEPDPGCWLCGYAWLREMEQRYAAEQAAAEQATELVFERIAAVSDAEARVADVTGWIERLQTVVQAYAGDDGRRGGGRAVELLADLLARLDASVAARPSGRGRPSVTGYVGAVLAVDSDWRSGRRSLPGRERTAWLAGCSDRAVYGAWQKVAALGWATRTRTGGRNSLERRLETGRANDRAEFDLVQLHRSPVPTAVRAQHVPAALGMLGELLAHALVVLDAEQDALDAARARADGWTDWQERVQRAQLRAAVARTRETVTDALPALLLTSNICRSHTVSKGEYLSSCPYWGLRFTPKITIHHCAGQARPHGRGDGAPRRAPTSGDRPDDLGEAVTGGTGPGQGCGAPPARHPRTANRGRRRTRRETPAWTHWAPGLLRELAALWPWVDRIPRAWAHTILGTKLGPDWTAHRLARWVTTQRTQAVLDNPAKPAAYLRTLLDNTLTGSAPPPFEAARHTQHHRHIAATAAAAAAADRHARLHAELAAQQQTATTDRARHTDGVAPGLTAARAAAAGRGARGRHTGPATTPSHSTTTAAAAGWEAAEPGSGLPAGWDHHRDR